jgi:hypothetical protein
MSFRMRSMMRVVMRAIPPLLWAVGAMAQASDADASARLRQMLPADVASRMFAVIGKARAAGLPADALENRALKFAVKGVDPRAIEKSVAEQAERMERVRDALQRARARKPAGDEIDAGAEAMRKGVDDVRVVAFAKDAPNDRSLAVPFYVIGSLLDRGLPSDSALARVEERLRAHASDRDIEKLALDAPGTSRNEGARGAEMGRALGATKRPGGAAGTGGGSAGGPPAGVPGNGGKPATPPGLGKKPPAPPGKP